MRNEGFCLAIREIVKELLRGKSLWVALHYKKIFLLKPAFALAYNAALLDYQVGRYSSACLWARRAEAQGCGEEKTKALILGLFALQAAGSPRFRQEVKKIQTVTDRWYAMDKFILTFLSGDMEAARAQIPYLLNTWYLNVPELAMVISCLLEQGNTRAADATPSNCALRRSSCSGCFPGRRAMIPSSTTVPSSAGTDFSIGQISILPGSMCLSAASTFLTREGTQAPGSWRERCSGRWNRRAGSGRLRREEGRFPDFFKTREFSPTPQVYSGGSTFVYRSLFKQE